MTVLSSHGHDLQLTVATTNQELETVRKKEKRQKKTASLSNNDAYIELAPIYHNTITTPALREDELHEEISEGPLLSMCRYVTCSWPGAVRPDAGPVIRASPARKAGRKREVRRSRWLSPNACLARRKTGTARSGSRAISGHASCSLLYALVNGPRRIRRA